MNTKSRIRDYWNWRAEDYDELPGHSGLKETWKSILARVFRNEEKILDVGTGTGYIALLLAELGYEVVGIDISEGMLKVARRKAEKMGLKVDFKIADAENLPFRDSFFDAVVSRHLLWTLPNPSKAVAEWRRVVKPGGKVVAVDGRWFENSMAWKVKAFIGKLGIAVYERRNPWKYRYDREVVKVLPCYGVSSEEALEIFRKAGLNANVYDLEEVRKKLYEGKPVFYRLAWDGREYFMVVGTKEVGV